MMKKAKFTVASKILIKFLILMQIFACANAEIEANEPSTNTLIQSTFEEKKIDIRNEMNSINLSNNNNNRNQNHKIYRVHTHRHSNRHNRHHFISNSSNKTIFSSNSLNLGKF